jgi:hypothetical protein
VDRRVALEQLFDLRRCAGARQLQRALEELFFARALAHHVGRPARVGELGAVIGAQVDRLFGARRAQQKLRGLAQ